MTTLRQLRADRDLTLQDLSGSVGIDPGNLSRIERGEQFPTKPTAKKLAKFYELSVPEIYGLIPESEEPDQAA